nr:glycoside hydrolase family 43 protein [uncultured Marinifilum sp.]
MCSFKFFLPIVFIFSILSCKNNSGDRNIARFYSFSYQGNNSFYTDNPIDSCQYYNPILSGFYPDPSICKKGDDFYLVNSSFSFFPGIPIFHSTNLTDWEQLGYVLNRPNQLKLDSLDISQGVFAPAITYNRCNDTFYLIGTVVGGGNNFIVKTKNPEGDWSEPIWLPEIAGIDPSLFIDENGKAYIVHNSEPEGGSLYDGHRAIRMWQYDLESDKITGESTILVNGGTDIRKKPIWIEGPHLYKIKDYYYLMCAEGGTAENHSEVIFRSKKVNGPFIPYNNNPILSQRQLNENRAYPVTSTGHADLIQDNNGDWWSVFLACRPYDDNLYNTGRETFLLPVKWKNSWPVILDNEESVPLIGKRAKLKNRLPLNKILAKGNFFKFDDFDKENLDFEWNFIRTPKQKWYNINTKEKCLEIDLIKTNIQEKSNPAFIGRRQQHDSFEVVSKMIFNAKKHQEAAGLVCFQNESNYLFFGKIQVGEKCYLQLEAALPEGQKNQKKILKQFEINNKKKELYLKIIGKGRYYDFYYTFDNSDWICFEKDVDASLLSTKKAGGFVGTYIGMYASANH